MAPSIHADPDPKIGFWGHSTSTLDWCEENYIVSFYVAEFWNTISNVFMIVPPLVGLYRCQRDRLEPRYTMTYLSLLSVGLGSWMFHCTLLYEMQLLDELPMLVTCGNMLYCLFEMGGEYNRISKQGYLAAVGLGLYIAVVAIVYLVIRDPTFHEIAYSVLVVGITTIGFYSLWKYDHQCRYLWWAIFGVSLYTFAFVLWLIDNNFCTSIRDFRKGLPFNGGFVAQFHSWWHVLAGLGSYFHILVSSRTRMEVLGRNTAFKTCLGLPYLVAKRKNND